MLRIPIISTLHERQLLFPLIVVLAVLGVLVQGTLVGEAPVEANDPEGPSPPMTNPAAAVRRPDLEKTPLTYFDDYWSQLLERVEDKVVLVGPEATPAVVVMPGLALTSAGAGEAVLAAVERERLASLGSNPEPDEPGATDLAPDPARPHGLIAVDRDRGLALFALDPSRVQPFQLVPPTAVPSGSSVGGVTRDRSGRVGITPGHVVLARADDHDSGDPTLLLSMPVFGAGATAIVNLDAALVGVAIQGAEPGDEARLLSATVVRQVVADLQRQVRCRAVVVSELEPPVLDLLGIASGLLVEQIRPGAFVPEPSLRVGDVILEWDGEAATTVEAFDRRSEALGAGGLARYRVLRGRRRLTGGTILPRADCRPVAQPPVQLASYGLALRWTAEPGAAEAWRVAATTPGGAAAAAGVRPDDLVLAVDGRPAEDQDVQAIFERLDRRGEPVLMTLQRADRVRIVALVPGE